MLQRKRTGSILCPSCGKLVGVADEQCYYCGRKNPGMWGLTSVLGGIGRQWPFESIVTGGCAFLYLAMLAVMAVNTPEQIHIMQGFQILPQSGEALVRFGASGAIPVFELDRWWTVLSAGWLHGDLIHIAFNLYWLRLLAPATAELYGSSRMVVIYTLASIGGFLASSAVGHFLPGLEAIRLGGAQLTVGASAPILGLLGAAVAYGRRTGSHAMRRQAWSYALYMIVFGFLMPRVDNWAHLGGFAGGFLAGQLLAPEEPERPGHTAAALVCLLATIASVVASLVDVRWYALIR
jgi:membrane associated rhomboid family serine protease